MTEEEKKQLEGAIKHLNKKFFEPFYEFLHTGNSTLRKVDYIECHAIVMSQCENGDNSEVLAGEAKKIITTFCRDLLTPKV
jgi:hypothetical protein